MRTLAREVAFKRIYESLFVSKEDDDLDVFFDENNIVEEEDKNFVKSLVDLYLLNKEDIDEEIKAHLVDFELYVYLLLCMIFFLLHMQVHKHHQDE